MDLIKSPMKTWLIFFLWPWETVIQIYGLKFPSLCKLKTNENYINSNTSVRPSFTKHASEIEVTNSICCIQLIIIITTLNFDTITSTIFFLQTSISYQIQGFSLNQRNLTEEKPYNLHFSLVTSHNFVPYTHIHIRGRANMPSPHLHTEIPHINSPLTALYSARNNSP